MALFRYVVEWRWGWGWEQYSVHFAKRSNADIYRLHVINGRRRWENDVRVRKLVCFNHRSSDDWAA